MSIRTKIMIGLLSLAGTQAMADATQSEFFYQAAAGKSAGTIQAGYIDRQLKVNDVNGTSIGTQKDSGLNQAGIRYEMGLTDQFSLEGVLTYTMLTINQATTGESNGSVNGLDNVQVNLKGTNGSYSWGRLRYGASNSIGVVPAYYTFTADNNNANLSASTGSYTFTPYIGADMDLGSGIMGAKVSYDLVKTDVDVHAPANTNSNNLLFTGGQELKATVFYELVMDQSLVGLALKYMNQGPSTSSLGGPNAGGMGIYGAKLYGRWGFADSWAIVPSVAYDIYGTKSAIDYISNLNISSGNELNVNLAARYAF